MAGALKNPALLFRRYGGSTNANGNAIQWLSQGKTNEERIEEKMKRIDCVGERTLPLYNQLALAGKNDSEVFFTGNERDADTLTNHCRLAVCGPHGVSADGNWNTVDIEVLRGRNVLILPNNCAADNEFASSAATALRGIAASVKIIDLAVEWHDLKDGDGITDVFEANGNNPEVFDTLDKLAAITPELAPVLTGAGARGVKAPKKPEVLLDIFDGLDAELFHDEVKEAFAAVSVDGHIKAWALDDGEFKTWLCHLFNKKTGELISSSEVRQVIEVLSARAKFDCPEPVSLSVRVAEHEKAFFYDLTDGRGRAVKTTADGWTIEDKPPIMFRRYRHQLAQVEPRRGGDVRKILRHINIRDDYHILYLCCLVSCYIPGIPHPIQLYIGEMGAAKTTACVLEKKIIDPSKLESIKLENNQRTLAVNLQQNWFLAFDNVSNINEHTSDALCRAITGIGIQHRKLHTNADDYIFSFQRCLAINGIENVVTRPDLLDRAIFMEVVRIPETERRALADVLSAFEADRADILGGIFDTLSNAMAIYSTIKLEKLPRMADFARWGYAIGEALGGLGDAFLAEYSANRAAQNTEAINADPVAMLIMEFMRERKRWEGLVSELHAKLAEIAPNFGVNPRSKKEFPSRSNVFSKRLNGIKSNLEAIGITFEKCDITQGTHITVTNERASP